MSIVVAAVAVLLGFLILRDIRSDSGGGSTATLDQATDEAIVTDTIPVEDGSAGGKIQVLSVDRILADTIHNVFCDESVSEIFAGENQLF